MGNGSPGGQKSQRMPCVPNRMFQKQHAPESEQIFI
jgi:hypothetical protein